MVEREVGSHDAPWQTVCHQFQALEVIVLEASDAGFEGANETSRNLTSLHCRRRYRSCVELHRDVFGVKHLKHQFQCKMKGQS